MKRVTNETNVEVELNVDGVGSSDSSTGIPFLDHMLDVSILFSVAFNSKCCLIFNDSIDVLHCCSVFSLKKYDINFYDYCCNLMLVLVLLVSATCFPWVIRRACEGCW